MPDNILVKPPQIRATAYNIAKSAQNITQATESVTEVINGLKFDIFSGNRATAVKVAYFMKRDVIRSMSKKLDAFSRMLYDIANRMEDADEKLGNSSIGQFPGDLFNDKGDLFKIGNGDKLAIDPNDINQGRLGDCYLLAALGALAVSHPEIIYDMISINDDGSYRVRFYNLFGKEVFIDVTADDVSGAYAVGTDGDESWVRVVETAYAKWKDSDGVVTNDSFEDIEGGFSSTVFRQITGNSAETHSLSKLSSYSFEDLQNDLGAGKPVTAASAINVDLPWDNRPLYENDTIVKGHAYYITSVNAETQTVFIENPWGYKDLEISFDEFKTHFRSVQIANV